MYMNAFLETVLAPFSAAYGAAVDARLALYRTGALTSHRIGVPVISVGNITTGGSGKTPLVEWMARALAREGKRPCVLTRGYGRANPQRRVVVSDGESILAGARESGDEPYLLAEKLQGTAAVISDRNRVAAARWALKNLSRDVFILDDGFQHLRIHRDLDVVTVDATNPFGGGRLLPRGHLRERPEALARADCIVITRADLIADVHDLRARVQDLSGGRLVIISRTRIARVRLLSATEKFVANNSLPPQPVAAFCAIGNPQAFFAQLARDGYTLSYTRRFRDHHVYDQSDIDTLARKATASGAQALVTTAKDAVKLRSLRCELPCYVAEIEIEFDDESVLLKLLRESAA